MEWASDLGKEVLYDETKVLLAAGGFSLVRMGMWHCPSTSAPRQVVTTQQTTETLGLKPLAGCCEILAV